VGLIAAALTAHEGWGAEAAAEECIGDEIRRLVPSHDDRRRLLEAVNPAGARWVDPAVVADRRRVQARWAEHVAALPLSGSPEAAARTSRVRAHMTAALREVEQQRMAQLEAIRERLVEAGLPGLPHDLAVRISAMPAPIAARLVMGEDKGGAWEGDLGTRR
jgi:hypothetical protein